jgi:uncharacterized protein (DUF433 family)
VTDRNVYQLPADRRVTVGEIAALSADGDLIYELLKEFDDVPVTTVMRIASATIDLLNARNDGGAA